MIGTVVGSAVSLSSVFLGEGGSLAHGPAFARSCRRKPRRLSTSQHSRTVVVNSCGMCRQGRNSDALGGRPPTADYCASARSSSVFSKQIDLSTAGCSKAGHGISPRGQDWLVISAILCWNGLPRPRPGDSTPVRWSANDESPGTTKGTWNSEGPNKHTMISVFCIEGIFGKVDVLEPFLTNASINKSS